MVRIQFAQMAFSLFKTISDSPSPIRFISCLCISLAMHILLLNCNCMVFFVVSNLNANQESNSHATVYTVQLPQRNIDNISPEYKTEKLRVSQQVAPSTSSGPGSMNEGDNQGASVVLPLPSGLYYPGRELTIRPKIIQELELDTPKFDDYLVPGKLTARLFINESGKVDAVVIDSSDLPLVFSEKIKSEFSEAQFKPGEKDGVAVKSQIWIEVNFNPR